MIFPNENFDFSRQTYVLRFVCVRVEFSSKMWYSAKYVIIHEGNAFLFEVSGQL